jgi:hypothetical protein
VHFVEKSAQLIERQKRALEKSVENKGISMHWHDVIEDIPEKVNHPIHIHAYYFVFVSITLFSSPMSSLTLFQFINLFEVQQIQKYGMKFM